MSAKSCGRGDCDLRKSLQEERAKGLGSGIFEDESGVEIRRKRQQGIKTSPLELRSHCKVCTLFGGSNPLGKAHISSLFIQKGQFSSFSV